MRKPEKIETISGVLICTQTESHACLHQERRDATGCEREDVSREGEDPRLGWTLGPCAPCVVSPSGVG